MYACVMPAICLRYACDMPAIMKYTSSKSNSHDLYTLIYSKQLNYHIINQNNDTLANIYCISLSKNKNNLQYFGIKW